MDEMREACAQYEAWLEQLLSMPNSLNSDPSHSMVRNYAL